MTGEATDILEWFMTIQTMLRVPIAAMILRRDALVATQARIFRVTYLTRIAIQVRRHGVPALTPIVSVILGRNFAVAQRAALWRVAQVAICPLGF